MCLYHTGLHGSGKTQAAHRYCNDMKAKYSIVTEIQLNKSKLVSKTFLDFTDDILKYKIMQSTDIDFDKITSHIKDYFNYPERQDFRLLLFNDNVDASIIKGCRSITKAFFLK